MTKSRQAETTNTTTAAAPAADRAAKSAARKARAAAIRSLMDDSGMSRREAVALVDAGLA